MRWAVCLLVASCAARSTKAPARAPTAAEIVERMEARYAAAKTYSDRGIVTSGYGESERRVTAQLSFDTTFVRGQRFRFDLRDDDVPGRGVVVWADPTHTYTRWYGPPHTVDDGPAFGVAITAANKRSLGVLMTLGHLLRPADVPPAKLTRCVLEGSEAIDDKPCWIVACERGLTPTKLWIDRDSYLVRRSSEPGEEGPDIATFTPVIDAAIDVAQVTPPDFSDDYEQTSAMLAQARTLVGKPAPPIHATVVTGAKLEERKGHVVVLDFWATWCGPCRTTMPRINEWHAKYASRGVQIIGLSSEDEAELRKFMSAQPVEYTIARDPEAKTARDYGVNVLPMIVVIDKAGVVQYVTLGARDLDTVEAVIESLLRR